MRTYLLRPALLAACCTAAAASGAIGLDVGSMNSVVAVARRGGVDVMTNEATRRQTPSVVSFDEQRRFMGESAASLRSSRPRSSVGESKLLLGLSLEQGEAVRPAPAAGLAADAAGGGVLLEVEYLGAKRAFSPAQLLAMLLHHLRAIAEREHGQPLQECALAVPAHFGAAQRQAVLDAVEVAGLHCVRLISDGAAAALDYALGRRAELPKQEEDGRLVAFVDAGASGVQVCVARIGQDALQLLAHAHAAGAGGAALDQALAERFAAAFQAQSGEDPLAQPRPAGRLRQACEKLRRTLSANRESTIALDCLVGEADLHGTLTRAELEELAQPLLESVGAACAEALAASGVERGELHSVEMVGGFSRTPALQQVLQEALGVPPRRTLNAEESVARGAAYAAALHSRHFKVKPLAVREGLLQPCTLRWASGRDGGAASGAIELEAGTALPLQKRLTVRTDAALSVSCEARRAEGAAEDTAATALECVVPERKGRGAAALWTKAPPMRAVRVDVAIDVNQLPSISAVELAAPPPEAHAEAEADVEADAAETQADTGEAATGAVGAATDEEEAPSDAPAAEAGAYAAQGATEAAGAAANATEGAEAGASGAAAATPAPPAAPAPPVPLTLTVARRLGLTAEQLQAQRAEEEEMRAADVRVEAALHAKNELEACVYRARDAAEAHEAHGLISAAEGDAMRARLLQLEDLIDDEPRGEAQPYDTPRAELEAWLVTIGARRASHDALAALALGEALRARVAGVPVAEQLPAAAASDASSSVQ